MIKVNIAQDIENIDMCEIDGEVQDEEFKDDTLNVRNIFGSIVDFITNKSGNEEDDSEMKVTDGKDPAALRRAKTAKSESPDSGDKKLNLEVQKFGLSQRDGNSGNDIASKVIGFFTPHNNPEQFKEDQTEPLPQDLESQSSWNRSMSKDEKLYDIDDESRQE
jgi:hypothetical protein